MLVKFYLIMNFSLIFLFVLSISIKFYDYNTHFKIDVKINRNKYVRVKDNFQL